MLATRRDGKGWHLYCDTCRNMCDLDMSNYRDVRDKGWTFTYVHPNMYAMRCPECSRKSEITCRCGRCLRVFASEDLMLMDDDDGDYVYACPICMTDEYLMDVDTNEREGE